MNGWIKVYDLANDRETVELVQQATTNTRDFGFVPEVALFGSDEWWRAVEDGRIPKQEVSGTIARTYISGHGDWPEFEVDSDGRTSCWTRVGEQAMYEEGREVRIEYVVQKARKNWLGSLERKQVLRIFIK